MPNTRLRNERRDVVEPVLRALAMLGYIVAGRKPWSFAAVAQYLAGEPRPPGIVWRQNTGASAYTDARGKKRFVSFGVPGVADIIGILRDGRWLAIECKQPGANVKPGSDQDGFLKCVKWMRGVSLVIIGGDDIVEALERIG